VRCERRRNREYAKRNRKYAYLMSGLLHGDGQVVGWISLADVGGSQVDGDALAGENQP